MEVKRMEEKLTQFNLYLNRDQIALLKLIAGKQGKGASALVRELIEDYINSQREILQEYIKNIMGE
jgi:predicted DNA-binding protein